MFVSDQRGLGNQRICLQLVLDRLGSNKLSAARFKQLLFAIGDRQKSIAIDVSDIAPS